MTVMLSARLDTSHGSFEATCLCFLCLQMHICTSHEKVEILTCYCFVLYDYWILVYLYYTYSIEKSLNQSGFEKNNSTVYVIIQFYWFTSLRYNNHTLNLFQL